MRPFNLNEQEIVFINHLRSLPSTQRLAVELCVKELARPVNASAFENVVPLKVNPCNA